MNQELVQYIADAKKHGMGDADIKKNLIDAGWDVAAVEEAMAHAQVQVDTLPPMHLSGATPPVQSPTQASASPVNMSEAANPTPQTTNVSGGLSEAHFATQQTSGNIFKKPIAWVGILVFLGIIVGGYFAYAKFYNNPTKVWQKFESDPKINTVKNTFTVKFSDPNDLGEDREVGGFQMKNVYLELTGDSYTDITDPLHPNIDGNFKYTFGAGNTSVTSGVGLRELDQDLYFKVGDNPFLANLVANIASKKYDWVKINLKDLEDTVSKNSSEKDKDTQVKIKNFLDKLGEATKKHKVLKMDKYLGKETINGVATFHFKNTLNKDEIKSLGSEWLDIIQETAKQEDDPIPDSELKAMHTAVSMVVDKFEVKEFETWIGKDDGKLYKVHFVSNLPSLIKLYQQAENEAKSESGDAKRLADIKQLATALELYNFDNEGYPDMADGKPKDLAPKYIGVYPIPPSTVGGACPSYYNNYWYQPTGTKSVRNGQTVYSSYELMFCLGQDTGGYKAGILKLGSDGIINIPCPGSPEQCKTEGNTASSTTNEEQQVKDFVSKMDFSAELRVDLTYSDYDKKQKLEAPSEFFNLNKFIEDNTGPMQMQ